MNAASISRPENDIITDESDSDASSDGIPDYYQPISSSDGEVEDNEPRLNGYHPAVDQHSNSSVSNVGAVQNGVTSLELSGDDVEEDDDEEEEMRRVAESDAAMRRAFLEDELRRNAPLPTHTSARVIEAMRAVSFSGVAPHWSQTLSDDRWVPQLQRLRHPPSTS
ncbi:hypothetical protein RND81_05G273000 [Saponaria officinalis]|uniref:Uncharacterized protein n=1 Tax=Saponaria officinalis TaxID=3572 RepID=A0AAW1L445_SAPOF